MTTNHTPGPWEINKEWNIIAPSTTNGIKWEVATVIRDCGENDDTGLIDEYDFESKANARLIVKSPEMYEILKGYRTGDFGTYTMFRKITDLLAEIEGTTNE